MKKAMSVLLVCGMVLTSFTACGSNNAKKTDNNNTETKKETTTSDNSKEETKKEEATPQASDGELVDGKFKETRKIKVEVYNRSNDGGSAPDNNVFTDYIKEGMLRDHNVEVEFVPVQRWGEEEAIANLLAAGDAPDICVTYSYPTILTYANMGGILNFNPMIYDNKDLLPNLYNWLGETNINWDKDPSTGTIWAIEAKLATMNRINTFVRRDWLEKLDMQAPTTLEDFEKMLYAFKDNAELLLGTDAAKMVPFTTSYDIGWRAANLIESFIDPDISDKDYYVYGFDDRKITQPNVKEAIRVLNKWYNADLMWKDFALYGDGDQTEDNMMKAGYVGSFMHNWDYPYRNNEDSIQANLLRQVGEDAAFVAIDPFMNSKGKYTKFLAGPVDRKIFFPATNKEPLACLLYLDWITEPEHLQFLQIGKEGVNHQVLESGAIQTLNATGADIMNSPLNIDYTITCNGMKLATDELTVKSRAYSYAGTDPALVEIADELTTKDGRIGKNVQVPTIEAESGLATALGDKRNVLYDNAVVAAVDQFDKVWDDGMADYLSSGGQAIIDERLEKWNATYGDSTSLPQ